MKNKQIIENKKNLNNTDDLDKIEKNVKKAIEYLNNGGVIVFPTDTVYGIGAIPNKKAINRIYKIKKRDFSKKIIALVNDKNKIFELIDETKENKQKIFKVIEKYWPGELTIIFRANKNFTKIFDDTLDTIGIRIPKNNIALNIIKNAGGIVLTTSANISGQKAAIQLKEIDTDILKEVDFVVNNIEKFSGTPSTIITYSNGSVSLIRKGNITLEDIKNTMNDK